MVETVGLCKALVLGLEDNRAVCANALHHPRKLVKMSLMIEEERNHQADYQASEMTCVVPKMDRHTMQLSQMGRAIQLQHTPFHLHLRDQLVAQNVAHSMPYFLIWAIKYMLADFFPS